MTYAPAADRYERLAYRRCELAWVNGDQIGVNFLKQGDKKKRAAKRGAEDAEV